MKLMIPILIALSFSACGTDTNPSEPPKEAPASAEATKLDVQAPTSAPEASQAAIAEVKPPEPAEEEAKPTTYSVTCYSATEVIFAKRGLKEEEWQMTDSGHYEFMDEKGVMANYTGPCLIERE
jgi:hypothetical protein